MISSVNHRMQSFVAWCGEVPLDAQRLDDVEALQHVDTRHGATREIRHRYVIAYRRDGRWWTVSFERAFNTAPPAGTEKWWIEACDSDGGHWCGNYYYWPEEDRWRDCLFERFDADYGRHGHAGPG